MTETVEAPVVEELPMITVNDLDTFVQYLIKWHSTKITLLQHMQQIPEGTTVQAMGEDAEMHPLEGDMLKGFKFGLEVALAELGALPFAIEFEDGPSATH